MWSGDYVTIEERYISTSTRPMTTKLDRDAASDEKMLSSKSHDPLITWIDQATWKKPRYISIFTRPMATKVDRMRAYDKEPKS